MPDSFLTTNKAGKKVGYLPTSFTIKIFYTRILQVRNFAPIRKIYDLFLSSLSFKSRLIIDSDQVTREKGLDDDDDDDDNEPQIRIQSCNGW